METGIRYVGYTIHTISDVDSYSQCREQCGEEIKCKFWSYFDSTSKCYLKTSDKGRTEGPESISGNRGCGDVIVSATADFTQNNLCGFKVPNLKGYRLENGDFIFSWRNKRVLTNDQVFFYFFYLFFLLYLVLSFLIRYKISLRGSVKG